MIKLKLLSELVSFVKVFYKELLIILGLILIINFYLGNIQLTIKADGEGYYDYLPALFIYRDFPSEGIKNSEEYSERIKNLGVYVDYNGKKINKYPCGTALLLSPFFIYAHLTSPLYGEERNGFSKPYQRAVFYGAIFYLFLGLILIKRLLLLYKISPATIFLIQILIVLGTAITSYTSYDPSFSHVYSFFAVSAFFFFTRSYFENHEIKHFILACTFLGLIIILKQINILIILFTPFLAGAYQKLKIGAVNIIKKPSQLISGLFLMLCVIFIQLILWYIQTGNFIIYSYQGEKFNFLHPAFFQLLFGYRKGLFIYSPLLLISTFGLFVFLFQKNYYLFFTWLTSFIIITYVFSSWWSWYYGCSFGARGYIEYYPAFFILLAMLIDQSKSLFRYTIIFLSLLAIPLNIIQTKQYKKYILDWINMDKGKYWDVFLRTADRYRGIFWKKDYNFNSSTTYVIHTESFDNIIVPANSEKNVYVDHTDGIDGFENVNIIQVSFDNRFITKEDATVELSIRDTLKNEIYYSHKIPLIHFSEQGLGIYHTGQYNFEIAAIGKGNDMKIILRINSKDNEVILNNVLLNFIHYKR